MKYQQVIDLQQVKRLHALWSSQAFNEKTIFLKQDANNEHDENLLFLIKTLKNFDLDYRTIAYLGSVKDDNGMTLFNEHFINFLQRVKTRMP
jgi:hypothetical protein